MSTSGWTSREREATSRGGQEAAQIFANEQGTSQISNSKHFAKMSPAEQENGRFDSWSTDSANPTRQLALVDTPQFLSWDLSTRRIWAEWARSKRREFLIIFEESHAFSVEICHNMKIFRAALSIENNQNIMINTFIKSKKSTTSKIRFVIIKHRPLFWCFERISFDNVIFYVRSNTFRAYFRSALYEGNCGEAGSLTQENTVPAYRCSAIAPFSPANRGLFFFPKILEFLGTEVIQKRA